MAWRMMNSFVNSPWTATLLPPVWNQENISTETFWWSGGAEVNYKWTKLERRFWFSPETKGNGFCVFSFIRTPGVLFFSLSFINLVMLGTFYLRCPLLSGRGQLLLLGGNQTHCLWITHLKGNVERMLFLTFNAFDVWGFSFMVAKVLQSDSHTPGAALLKGLSWEIYPFLFSSSNLAFTSDLFFSLFSFQKAQGTREGVRNLDRLCKKEKGLLWALVDIWYEWLRLWSDIVFSISNNTEALAVFWHSLFPCNNQVHSSGHCYFPVFHLFSLSLLPCSLWRSSFPGSIRRCCIQLAVVSREHEFICPGDIRLLRFTEEGKYH